VLLDDLLEARVVQLGELGEIVHIGDDVAQILLEQVKVLLGGVGGLVGVFLHAADGVADLLL
jgi:hypothetical protein